MSSHTIIRIRTYLIAVSVLFFPIAASALGISYFEFNPDYYKTQSLNIVANGPVYEIFLPINEYLSGFDFWFDNSGSPGPVSFKIYDTQNSLISSKTVTVPHIDPVVGGQRFHVDLDSQISVVGNSKYKTEIESELPDLRIYYANWLDFLGHNAPVKTLYQNGVASVGGEEKEYSFNFSLYERQELSPPIISNTAITILSYYQARLDFNTNEPVDYKLDYGLNGQSYTKSMPFDGSYGICTQGLVTCSMTLDISPNSSYQYTLTVKDVWGNQNHITGTFNSESFETQTPLPTATPIVSATLTPTPSGTITPTPLLSQDNIPPIISSIKIVHLSDKDVHISWETNEAADSNLLISFTTEKITIAAVTDSTQELLHLLKIDNQLNPKTKYLATITSRDPSNNTTATTIDFTTLALGQVSPAPTPSQSPSQQPQSPAPSINPQSQTNLPNLITVNQSDNGQDIIVAWTAPVSEPSSGYRIDVFDENKKLLKTETIKPGVHQATITGVGKNNNTVIVYTNNNGVYEKVSAPVKIKSNSTLIQRFLAFWPLLLVAVVSIAGLLVRKLFFKRKTVILPPTE